MFNLILKDYCEDESFEIREYSGRYGANGLMGIVIPNGMRSFGMFVHELTLIVCERALELQGEEKESESQELYELLDDFIKSLEFDSMGRDDQILYSRKFKWEDYQNAIGEDEED
jgi:hypothetical protein